MGDFSVKMLELKAEWIPDRHDATEERIDAFEKHVGASLPPDYRAFLAIHSGVFLSATCPIIEPCPCGDEATIECFYGFMPEKRLHLDLIDNCDLFEGAPVAIPIAEGGFGSRIFLLVSGKLTGSVFVYDGEHRFSWPDEQFHQMYENLDPQIQTYLDHRKNGKLPPKRKGFDNFYHIADSFTAFLESCKYWDLDAVDDQ